MPLVNGTFDTDIEGWAVFPMPDPDSDERFVIWDEDTQSALLIPYGESTVKSSPDTDSILSQEFFLPSDAVSLAFEVTMETSGSGFETDILTVTVNDNSVYQLTSSDVNDAAMNDDTHVIEKIVDQNDLLQYAKYKISVNTIISNLAGSNINLDFTLHNDNADECVTRVYIDNVYIDRMLELWPPNHKYHSFDLYDFINIPEGNVELSGKITSIYSDEPEDVQGNGDGNTTDDIIISGDSSFEVRAERQGASNGRVYGVAFNIQDEDENITEQGIFYLGVPHDQSGDPPVNDGSETGYTVTVPNN
jgi:hypothetical protein